MFGLVSEPSDVETQVSFIILNLACAGQFIDSVR